MKEIYGFRIVEEFASRLFLPAEGRRLGESVRKIDISPEDSRFQSIGQLQEETRRREGRSFFYGWAIRRRYSKSEFALATIFHLRVASTFEPAGEERGTEYDESTACSFCGAGATQISPLYLPPKRIPKRKDFNRTIAGEIVVSRRAAELFEGHGITGAEMRPICSPGPRSVRSEEWFQLVVRNTQADVAESTRVGIDPFDDDAQGECRCPTGDLIGLNLLSEVYIHSASRGDEDIISTRQFVGTRRGLLRPERIILISPRLQRLIESENLRGVEIEVAHSL